VANACVLLWHVGWSIARNIDEPTASLDSATGTRVMAVLQRQLNHGMLLVVTHDPEMLENANVIFRMRDGVLSDTVRNRD
jgi:ABC-type lipoprotein export system ATPase subunit